MLPSIELFAYFIQGRHEKPLVGGCKAEFTWIYVVNKLLYGNQSLFIAQCLTTVSFDYSQMVSRRVSMTIEGFQRTGQYLVSNVY